MDVFLLIGNDVDEFETVMHGLIFWRCLVVLPIAPVKYKCSTAKTPLNHNASMLLNYFILVILTNHGQ